MMKIKNKQLDVTLILILLAALILNTYNIWQDNAANQYYLAAVKSMTQSFHNFFFASFDSSGFVSVDKPPLVLWIQTIFAKIFGVHTWSVILPQALAGAGSVYLLYVLIKPKFGKGAARISALVMALTPIAVAVSRTNNIDSMLVFTLLFGTWCLMKTVKQGRLLWLLAAFGLIGLGFNMKMLQAFMVLPAFLLFYLIAAHANWKKKLCPLFYRLLFSPAFRFLGRLLSTIHRPTAARMSEAVKPTPCLNWLSATTAQSGCSARRRATPAAI